MKSALQVHNELEKYLGGTSGEVCFSEEQYIDIATKHLKNPDRMKSILRKNTLTAKNIYELTEYPYGIMFLEIGGHFSFEGDNLILHKDFQKTCWDTVQKTPHIYNNNSTNDWHIHPWNLVGYGHPPFFSRQDIEDACTHFKRKLLYVGNLFFYKWPRTFLLDMSRCNRESSEKIKEMLFDIINILETGTPFIDPKIDWESINKELLKFNANLNIF